MRHLCGMQGRQAEPDPQVAEGLDAYGPDGARWGFTRRARGNEGPEGAAEGGAGEGADGEDEDEDDEEEVRVAVADEVRAKQLLSEIGEVSEDVKEAMEEMKRARVRDAIYEKLDDWARTHEAVAERLEAHDKAAAAERRGCAAALHSICERFLETTTTKELAALVDEADPFDPDDPKFSEALDDAAEEPEPAAPPEPPSLLEILRSLKAQLAEALVADDRGRIGSLLEEIAGQKLKWDPVREAAIGKEVGIAAKHSDPAVADPAKAIIATLHKLARSGKAGNSYGR